MINHEIFFESSCQIDIGTGISAKHLDLREVSDCDTKQEAKHLLEALRKRLSSANEGSFEMSQESKLRLIALLSNH